MADSEKNFACSSSGCTMSFTNEDQLTVHKKKHDMMLNLGSSTKNNGFVADQTPTPTRFIRNCEEVGLFQDLQNVNPFEETFRRAVESGNTGALTVPETGITDDTLHTPHIFPHIADVLSTSNQMLPDNSGNVECGSISITEKTREEKATIGTEVCTSIKLGETVDQHLIKEKLTVARNVTLTESIIDQVSRTSIVQKTLQESAGQQLSINGEEVQLLLKTADGKLMQLSAIPVCEGVATGTPSLKQQTVVIKTEPALQCNVKVDSKKSTGPALSLAKMKLKQSLTKSIGSHGSQRARTNCAKEEASDTRKENRGAKTTEEQQVKKKEILERNRASSMRARAKRKAWIQQLERTVANVNETNVALQMEIKVLRSEVAKLKTLLLAHKDCPVTRAMQKGNGIVLGPKIISVNTDTTPTFTSVKRSAGAFAQTDPPPIVPKKKVSLAPLKNPVIFPKIVEAAANLTIPGTALIKTVPAVKILSVGQLLAEKEGTKQIFIVQNSPKKVDAGNPPRQIIQINPNYEIEQKGGAT